MIARFIIAVGCGALFGAGLAISQMANPAKILNFLDVFGAWDPSLLIVLAAAAGTTMIAFRFVGRMRAPVFETTFETAPANCIDVRLIAGAAIFGIGWGLSGFCPGPAVVAAGRLAPDALVFMLCFFAGSWVYRRMPKAAESFRRAPEP